MASLEIKDLNGKTTKSVELPSEIFEVQVNIPLMHQVVTAQLAAARSGNAHTKTRAEVSGGGRKPYKQKGTGRARQGSIRAPHYAGGGVSHGPRTRDYDERTPKKMKAAALRSALSDRARDSRIHVITEIVAGEKPSTKSALAALANVVKGQKVLVVLTRQDPASWFSLRNVPGVHTIAFDQVNTYDVIVADDIVFSEAAFDAFLKLNNKEVSA
jgi:large subunit ribosomal protein L4